MENRIRIDLGGAYSGVGEEFAHGGMGGLYLTNHSLEGKRAVKVFDPTPNFVDELIRLSGKDRDWCLTYLRKRFIKEAKHLHELSKRFKDARFAHVYDLYEDAEHPYFVMDYIESASGRPMSLKEYIKKVIGSSESAPTLERIERWFEELVDQIACLHDSQFIHRDIKPENILLDRDDHVVLVDFGIGTDGYGRLAGSVVPQNTSRVVILGTKGYLAPELDRGEVSPKVDVYSLGMVFWELFTLGDKDLQFVTWERNFADFNRGCVVQDPERAKQWLSIFQQLLMPDPSLRCGDLRALCEQVFGAKKVYESRTGGEPLAVRCSWRRVLTGGIIVTFTAGVAFVWLMAGNRNRRDAIPQGINGATPIVIDRPVVFTNRNWKPSGPVSLAESRVVKESVLESTNVVLASMPAATNVGSLQEAANRWLRENNVALGRSVFFDTTNAVVIGSASGSLRTDADLCDREMLRNKLFRQAVFDCAQAALPVGSTGCDTLQHFTRILPQTEGVVKIEVLLVMRFYSGRQRSRRGNEYIDSWIAGQRKCDLMGPHRYIDCEGNVCGVGGVGYVENDALSERFKREARQMARIALGAPITVEWLEDGPAMDESDTVVVGGYNQYGCLAASPSDNGGPEAVSVFSICKHKDSDEGFDPATAAGKTALKTPDKNPKGYKSASDRIRAYLMAQGICEGFTAENGSVVHVESDTFDCEDPRNDSHLFMRIDDAVLNAYQRAHVAVVCAMGRNLTDEMYAKAGISPKSRDEIRDVDGTLRGWELLHESLKTVVLNGVRVLREEQAWDAERKKYEVAVAFAWSPVAEREANAFSTSKLTADNPGKYSVQGWLDAQFDQDLVTSTGPLRYVDNKGDYWFIGVGVRELNLEEEAFFPDSCKMNSQSAAQMMARVSLYGGVTLFERGREIEVIRSAANERTDAAVADGLRFALRHCREKVSHLGMRIFYQGKRRHELSGKETIVTVVGLRASEVDFSNWKPKESRQNRFFVSGEPSAETKRKIQERDLRFKQLERNFDERAKDWK